MGDHDPAGRKDTNAQAPHILDDGMNRGRQSNAFLIAFNADTKTRRQRVECFMAYFRGICGIHNPIISTRPNKLIINIKSFGLGHTWANQSRKV
jgi:hypothetical protein